MREKQATGDLYRFLRIEKTIIGSKKKNESDSGIVAIDRKKLFSVENITSKQKNR